MDDLSRCVLCAHRCGVDRLAGERGVCGLGTPQVASYTLHPAPPRSFTIFMAGCNFRCLGCQNWTIAHHPDNAWPVEGPLDPEDLAREGLRQLDSAPGRAMGADRFFFSGGEATASLPYVEQVVAAVRQIRPQTKVNFDTNGFLTEESLRRVLAFADSITFDLKAFHDDTHRALTGAPVAPVLRNAETLAREAPEKLWEFRILVIPGLNEEEVEPLCRFVHRLGPDLPVCFLAFRPNFALQRHPGASRPLMEHCVAIAEEVGLTAASWAGRPGLSGVFHEVPPGEPPDYEHLGARRAGSLARAAGCITHPRDCGDCPSADHCEVKRTLAVRCT